LSLSEENGSRFKYHDAATDGMSTTTITGDCNVYFDGRRESRQRGRVLVVVKPDDTVLVHDAEGYQPVAWLTRPAELSLTRDPLWLVATDDEETLRLEAAGEVTVTEHEVSDAGVPVGSCRCGGQLVRSNSDVSCLDCGGRYSLPAGARTTESTCSCGLPRFRVERGADFELCLDYECGSLLDAVSERFDGNWNCPKCDGDLRILRRGGLIAGCENYPDCDTGFALPEGVVLGECDCGLPRFEMDDGERCLDTTCECEIQ
jgi:DNA topoisomerase-1